MFFLFPSRPPGGFWWALAFGLKGLKGAMSRGLGFGCCFFWGNHFANPPFVLLGLALRRGGFYPPCGPLVDNVCGYLDPSEWTRSLVDRYAAPSSSPNFFHSSTYK